MSFDLDFPREYIIFVAAIIFMVGIWGVDVSSAAITLENGGIRTIYGSPNPFFVYHLSLLFAIGSFAVVGLLALKGAKDGS